MLYMADRLSALRREAEARDCEFRALTLLREPVSRERSEIAHSSEDAHTALSFNGQARFLLVNADNSVSKTWPSTLTSENSNLPELLEDTKSILDRSFDWIFTSEDILRAKHEIDAFLGVAPIEDASSDEKFRGDYSRANGQDLDRVQTAHAHESDWLDAELYSWASARPFAERDTPSAASRYR